MNVEFAEQIMSLTPQLRCELKHREGGCDILKRGIPPPGYKSIMVISGGMILFLNADHFFGEKRKPPIEGGNSVLKILEKNREN
jgi:hypothetical protein